MKNNVCVKLCSWFLVLSFIAASAAVAAFAKDSIGETYPVSPIEGYPPVPSEVYDHLITADEALDLLYPVIPIDAYPPVPSEVYDHLITAEEALALLEPVDIEEPAPGDVNGDGRITSSDARLALRCAAKLDRVDPLTLKAIDMDEDGLATAADARKILRIGAKLDRQPS